MAFAFSAQNWGASTRKLTEWVKKRTVGQITMIINEAQSAPLTLSPKREAGTCASAGTKDDRYGDICKSYHATIHSLIFVVSFRISSKSQHSSSSSSICASRAGLFSVIIYCRHPNTMLPAYSLRYPTPSCSVAPMIFLYLHAPRQTFKPLVYLFFTHRMAANVFWRCAYSCYLWVLISRNVNLSSLA